MDQLIPIASKLQDVLGAVGQNTQLDLPQIVVVSIDHYEALRDKRRIKPFDLLVSISIYGYIRTYIPHTLLNLFPVTFYPNNE
jgi:hypothetical protein